VSNKDKQLIHSLDSFKTGIIQYKVGEKLVKKPRNKSQNKYIHNVLDLPDWLFTFCTKINPGRGTEIKLVFKASEVHRTIELTKLKGRYEWVARGSIR